MGRCAPDWEGMTPVGTGEVGPRGPSLEEPLFPQLCPLGHPAGAGPALACPGYLWDCNAFGGRKKSRSVACLHISGVGHLKLHLVFLTMAIFLLPTYFLAHLLLLSRLRSTLLRSDPVSMPPFRCP